jgi:hypothetical protein
MKHLINDIYWVEVPEDAKRFWIEDLSHGFKELTMDNDENWDEYKSILLSTGNYSIIGNGDELGESDWVLIIDKPVHSYTELVYRDYEKTAGRIGYLSAKESGHSLLKSKNLNPSTTLLIRKNS